MEIKRRQLRLLSNVLYTRRVLYQVFVCFIGVAKLCSAACGKGSCVARNVGTLVQFAMHRPLPKRRLGQMGIGGRRFDVGTRANLPLNRAR